MVWSKQVNNLFINTDLTLRTRLETEDIQPRICEFLNFIYLLVFML